jgi:glycosyltransferase involved in cell wall biosynthesis
MKKLAVITTHPIQYNAPLFELLSQRKKIEIKVFYTWGESVLQEKYDPGFDRVIEWNIPLLKGYDYEFLENVAKDKGSHYFKGIDNPHIIETIEKYKPDAVLVFGWSFKSHLKVLKYFKNKIPVLFRGDSTLLNDTGFLPALKRNIFFRWVYRHVDFALYVGENNYEYFKKAGLKKEQMIFAPHVIDNERFSCETEKCNNQAISFRQQLQIPSSALVFLFAGKFEPVKNPAIIPAAFSTAQFDSSVHLVMVGNGILEKDLKDKYAAYPKIHFLDFQNQLQMPAIYGMADVFILSSVSETWGLAVNEAMANGKVIIVSDKCGCAVDLVEENLNGYIFKSGDVAHLQIKMKTAIENRQNIERMKQNSKNRIMNFSLGKVAGSIEKLINRI